MATRYRVYVTPRATSTTYGAQVDITSRIEFNGIPTIKKAGADSSDYDIGVFTYGDIQLKAINEDGYLSDESDSRSIFTYKRDLAKVDIEFSNDDGDTIVFRGLINEEATRANVTGDAITFRVLSRDSVIRNTKVSAGTISNGMLASSAIGSILNVPAITSVLTYDVSNINLDYDFTINDGSKFDNKSTRDVMNRILLAANSVMLVNDAGEMIVRSRDENTDKAILNLYGPYDIHRRQNLLRLTAYNTGLHRTFTAVRINDTEEGDSAFQSTFGYRQKEISMNFITSSVTESAIATRLLGEFKAPKIELNVEVPTWVARDVEIFDRVSINYPLRLKPIAGTFMPVIGVTKIDDAMMPLPDQFGSLMVSPNVAFKVIEIAENPNDFETILKLRQMGSGLSDGVFNVANNAIVGYAIIDSAVIVGDGDPNETWNPATIGGARVGNTAVA